MSAELAIVILGCRVEPGGDVRGALKRRLARGARVFREHGARWVIVSGGKRWQGISEAQAMRHELERLGVPGELILEEARSCSTRENAFFSRALLDAHAIDHIRLVTCDFHMRRAAGLFRDHGLRVTEHPARSPISASTRAQRSLSELFKSALDRYLSRRADARSSA